MRTIKFSADIFIIPNHATRLSDLSFEPYRNNLKEFNGQIVDINGIENIDLDKEHFVQMWIVAPELSSDNLIDHSGTYIDPETGDKYRLNIKKRISNFAKSFFEGHKEGDTINIKIPVTLEPKSSDKDICLINSEDEEAIADVSLTLKQTSYRYARFGNFETVLHDVCR